MKFRNLALVALVGLGLVAARAEASFKLKLSNDGASTTIQDNLAGDNVVASGVIQSTVTIGDYSLVISIANSKPLLGSATAPSMQIAVGSITYTPTGVADPNLIIEVTDTDFAPFGAPNQGYEIGLGSSTATSGSFTYEAYSSTTNNEFQYDDKIGSTLNVVGLASSAPSGGSTPADGSTSISLRLVLTSKEGDVSQATASLRAVPEPATLTVWSLLASVVGLGAVIRRRMA